MEIIDMKDTHHPFIRVEYTDKVTTNDKGDDVVIVKTGFGPIPIVIPKVEYKIVPNQTIPYEDECFCECHNPNGTNWIHHERCCRPRPKNNK